MANRDPGEPLTQAEEAAAAVAQGLGSVLEIADDIEYCTHAGTKRRGVIEDINLIGALVRTSEDLLFFVPFSSIDDAQVFEAADDGDGDDAEVPEVPDAEVTVEPARQTVRRLSVV